MAPEMPRHERPIWIWDLLTANFVWANSQAIKFWATSSLEQLQAIPCEHAHPAWKTISDIFAPTSPSSQMSTTGIDLPLAFPKNTKVYQYEAACRLAILKQRNVVIVELLKTISSTDEKDTIKIHPNKEPLNKEKALNAKMPINGKSPFESPLPQQAQAMTITQAKKRALPKTNTQGAQQMNELANLIRQSKTHDHETSVPPPPADPNPPQTPSDQANQQDFWENLSLDITALQKATSQEEIEQLLNNNNQPLAMVHTHHIIYANNSFVSEFGYGELTSLENDGTDWILPQSRPLLAPFYETNRTHPLILENVRLCSGRALQRPVYIAPLRLVKFDRTFLLLTLGDIQQVNHQQGKNLNDGQNNGRAHDQTLNEDTDVSTRDASPDDPTNLPFLAAISHEVRVPLNIIIGFSELMIREEFGPLGNKKYQDYIQDIHQSAHHAYSLINDLLDYSKLKSGQWSIEKKPLDLNEAIREQVHLIRDIAARQAVKLRSSLEENLPLILADQRALNQILLNLLSNAIKFTPNQGNVTVATQSLKNGDISLTVTDTGEGMNELELAKATQPFQQSQKGTQKRGTGLGLPIAKALSKANDFEFFIESQKDQGTTITIVIKDKQSRHQSELT